MRPSGLGAFGGFRAARARRGLGLLARLEALVGTDHLLHQRMAYDVALVEVEEGDAVDPLENDLRFLEQF